MYIFRFLSIIPRTFADVECIRFKLVPTSMMRYCSWFISKGDPSPLPHFFSSNLRYSKLRPPTLSEIAKHHRSQVVSVQTILRITECSSFPSFFSLSLSTPSHIPFETIDVSRDVGVSPPSPVFSRSVNTIRTRRVDFACHINIASPPERFGISAS